MRADAGDGRDIGLVRWRMRSDSFSMPAPLRFAAYNDKANARLRKRKRRGLRRRVGLDHHKDEPLSAR
ncbi:hypothetical protein X743_11570 [Mesorhizobium sp. LNHC252B00]|nr:hypothetical protein X743_11570 [Mesorhizobium sp. LNHC252B00]